jgi:hypothetical protein
VRLFPLLALLGLLVLAHGSARIAAATTEVDLYATVVAQQGTTLLVDADGVRLTLDVSEIDPRFVQSLRPGDEVRIAAFRLPEGGLLVYSIFLQSPGEVGEERPPGPQGGPD